MPGADGSNGQVLTTNGSGTLSWETPASSGANATLSNLTSPTSINQDLIFQSSKQIKNLNKLLMGTSTENYVGAPIEINTGGALGSFLVAKTTVNNSAYAYMTDGTNAAAFGLDGLGLANAVPGGFAFGTFSVKPIAMVINGAEKVRIDTSGNMGIGTNAPGSKLDVKGTLRLSGSSSGYVGFAPAADAGSTTYTLPDADGSSGQVLTTDGSGVLSWVAQPANDKKTIVLVSGDITNQYVDLDHVAKAGSIMLMVKGGAPALEGSSYDYTVNLTGGAGGVTRITFANDLATGGASALVAGDVLQINYVY